MLICATPQEAKIDQMESVNPGQCRDCECSIVYDGKSHREAMNTEYREDRPVEFFCIACAVKYDFGSITHLGDHRGGRNENIAPVSERNYAE